VGWDTTNSETDIAPSRSPLLRKAHSQVLQVRKGATSALALKRRTYGGALGGTALTSAASDLPDVPRQSFGLGRIAGISLDLDSAPLKNSPGEAPLSAWVSGTDAD
jgi:hypothetical protein